MAHTTRSTPLWRRHGLTLLFGAAVVLLIALSLWWFAFLRLTLSEQQATAAALLDREVALAAIRMSPAPAIGPLADDPRFHVLAVGQLPLLKPAHWVGDGRDVHGPAGGVKSNYWVQPTAVYLQSRQDHFGRRQGMVLGEGVMLLSLLLAVVSMLYRLSRAETRVRSQMQAFLGRMTHELKTPLAGVKAVLETLRAGHMPTDQQAPLLTMALQAVERQEHLIQNLLLAQRLRLPEQRLVRNRIEIEAFLTKFVDHRLEILGGSATITVQCPPTLAAVGDDVALWTVLENLVDNALKYGGKQLKIQAVIHLELAQIAVNDDGVGFVSDQAEALFEPWVTSAADRHANHGTGLGLSISRQLMRQMAGDVRAHSAGPAQGATFTISLPLAPN